MYIFDDHSYTTNIFSHLGRRNYKFSNFQVHYPKIRIKLAHISVLISKKNSHYNIPFEVKALETERLTESADR